jgi:hypothetical protein
MELIAILIALAVVVFGGRGFANQLKKSPTVDFVMTSDTRYGKPKVIAVGVVAVILLYFISRI